MSLSKETIIEASLRVLNRDGINALVMRNIAKELNVKAASLYWHFRGKKDLYGEIAEYMCAGYQMPEENNNEDDFLTEAYQAYRLMLLSVRDGVALLENSVPNTPIRKNIIQVISNKLLQMGVSSNNLITISNLLNNYVLSFVADECRYKNMPLEDLESFKCMLPKEDGAFLLRERDFDSQFLYGLRVLFAGIKTIGE